MYRVELYIEFFIISEIVSGKSIGFFLKKGQPDKITYGFT